jgi:uncharacterized protein YggT (Ycf19 family)
MYASCIQRSQIWIYLSRGLFPITESSNVDDFCLFKTFALILNAQKWFLVSCIISWQRPHTPRQSTYRITNEIMLHLLKPFRMNQLVRRPNARGMLKIRPWIVSGGVALLHACHKTGLMCTTVYLWCYNHLFCILPGFMAEAFFCVAFILVEVVWTYRQLFIAIFWVSTNCRPH